MAVILSVSGSPPPPSPHRPPPGPRCAASPTAATMCDPARGRPQDLRPPKAPPRADVHHPAIADAALMRFARADGTVIGTSA